MRYLATDWWWWFKIKMVAGAYGALGIADRALVRGVGATWSPGERRAVACLNLAMLFVPIVQLVFESRRKGWHWTDLIRLWVLLPATTWLIAYVAS